jgi:spoIIIJ-associated protein
VTDSQPDTRVDEDSVAEAREFLAGILERMGIDAEIAVRQGEDQVRLEIQCEDVQRIIGRRGQLVDALQHLVGKKVAHHRVEGRGRPIVVDAGGYREKQVERLQSLAERMGQKALKGGGPVELSPMNAHERRIVHLTLAEMAGVTTRSEGQGDLRHVVVFPEPDGPEAAPRAK